MKKDESRERREWGEGRKGTWLGRLAKRSLKTRMSIVICSCLPYPCK